MFCWALVLPRGVEPELLLRQSREGVGIFSCDAHLAISNTSLTVAFGAAAAGLKTAIIDTSLFTPLGGKYYTALNSPVFIKAWHAVFQDGRYRSYDWTLKLDADTVFLPGKVRTLLGRHCSDGADGCRAKYLTNFGGDIHGPVEALSRRAMELYDEKEAQCTTQVDYSDKGEDWYLGLCMELLGIPGEEEPSLLSDWHLDRGFPSACDTVHATFHPFKNWDYYFRCLCESGFGTPACDRMMAPTTTMTSTYTSTTVSTSTRTTVTLITSTATTTTVETTKTRTTTSRRTTTSTTAAPHRDSVIVFDGRGDAQHSGGGAPPGPASGNLHWLPSAFWSSGANFAAVVAAAGLLVGAGIGVTVAVVSRKFRARRVDAIMASPVPTSPSRNAASSASRGAVPTAEPSSSTELLLRTASAEAAAPGDYSV